MTRTRRDFFAADWSPFGCYARQATQTGTQADAKPVRRARSQMAIEDPVGAHVARLQFGKHRFQELRATRDGCSFAAQ